MCSRGAVLTAVRTMLVDQSVREQSDKLQETFVEDSRPVDMVCRNVFKEGRPRVCDDMDVTLGSSLYSDVDVYPDLLQVLDKTSTLGGRACLRAILDSPISDTVSLTSRQRVLSSLKAIVSIPSRNDVIRQSLAAMKAAEPDIAWALQHPHQDAEMRALYEMAFFKIWPLRRLNKIPLAVTALNCHRIVVSPLIGLLSPLVYFVIPYLVLRFRVGIKVSVVQYLKLMRASMSAASSLYSPTLQWASLGFSLVFYFQGLFSSVEMAGTLAAVCSSICRRSKSIDAFKNGAGNLVQVCAPLGGMVLSSFFPDTNNLSNRDSRAHPPPSRCRRPMLLQNFGRHLAAFKSIDLDGCRSLMQDAYALDALVSVVDARDALGACDVTFVACAPRPVFDAVDMTHPCIPADRSVPNSISMQRDGACAALLTGPNAGGKSTLLKSMLIATIMAQTLTIACCKQLRLTPYSHIHSHINVPDVQGSKSLFQAEMERARESMDVLSKMKATHPDRFSLLVMDEVFSSTNPVEGIAGAYSVAKNLALSANATLIVSTHFLYLRKLALLAAPGGKPLFQLVQMPVKIDPSSAMGFTYPYRIHEGVCEQLIALELLKASGFSADVIHDALEIKRTLMTPLLRRPAGRGKAPASDCRRGRPVRKQTS